MKIPRLERCIHENLYEACMMCGQPVDSCICHQCPICFEHGNPQCYLPHPYGHAIPYCDYQLKSLNLNNNEYRIEREREDRFWDEEFILDQFNRYDDYFNWISITYCSEEHRECLLQLAIAMNAHDCETIRSPQPC